MDEPKKDEPKKDEPLPFCQTYSFLPKQEQS